MPTLQRSTALELLLVMFLLPAGGRAYNPFSTGAPPTLEMVRAACGDEVARCELDCSRDTRPNVEPDPASGGEGQETTEDRPLTDIELNHLIELNRPAATVKVALRKVSLTKSQIQQLIALEERTPGVYGNRRVIKNMLMEKTPSDKYERKQYCCGEMLKAVLNGKRSECTAKHSASDYLYESAGPNLNAGIRGASH